MRRRGGRADTSIDMIATNGYHQQRATGRFIQSVITLIATLTVVAGLVVFVGTHVVGGFACAGRSLASVTQACSAPAGAPQVPIAP